MNQDENDLMNRLQDHGLVSDNAERSNPSQPRTIYRKTNIHEILPSHL